MKKKSVAGFVFIVLQLLAIMGSGVRLVLANHGGSTSIVRSQTAKTTRTSPTINGVVVYPTLAQSLSNPINQSDWKAGSIYPHSSSTQNARSVSASLVVPSSLPPTQEFYYVLLSCFDSYGSYDQLGFCANNGQWEITYSFTIGDPYYAENYYYNASAFTLSQGAKYTFNMTVQNGTVNYIALQDSTIVWSMANSTGGNYLVLGHTYNEYGRDWDDYTDYEEIYTTVGAAPGFNFYFGDQYWVGLDGSKNAATSWERYDQGSVPSGVNVVFSGSIVWIGNPGIKPYAVDISVTSVNPLPPHYSVFQVYHHGMRLDGQPISMNYTVTVSRTDNDAGVGSLYVEVGLNRTNVNNATDTRNIGTGDVYLASGNGTTATFTWNETSTMNPGNYSITGYANVLDNNTFDIDPSGNQLTNDTVQAKELIGDVNGDGDVDILDAIAIGIVWGLNSTSPRWNPDADLNKDGNISILDYIVLGLHFGESIGGGFGGLGSGRPANGVAQPATAGTPSVFVDPSQLTVFKGEVFTANVKVTGVTDLYGWEFKLYWNSTVLNCTNVVVQTPAEWQNNTQNCGPGLEANYNATDALYWQGQSATYPASSFNGSMTIATLTFQAMQPGTTSLTLTGTILGNSTAEPIACSVSSGSVNVYYGRYMRSDTQTINGLGAYVLNIPESTSSASVTQSGSGHGASWGIRAFVRHSDGTEQEITLDGQSGTPKAVVYRTGGSGVQSATVAVAQTGLQPTDSLVTRVYAQVGDSGWTLGATFTTERLQATTLQAATWTVYYYTYAYYYRFYSETVSTFYWGTITYNSRVQNLQYT